MEITGSPAPAEQRAALERRCSDILGARRCRIVSPGESGMGSPACWQVVVTTGGGDPPRDASVVLNDVTDPEHVPVRRDVTFRPNDVVPERWATLGLVIAALVTVEEHSAAEETPVTPFNSAGGGFAPVVEVNSGASLPSSPPLAGEIRVVAVGAIGLLPESALGVRVEGSLARRWLALVARATVFPTDSRTTFSAGGAGGDVQLSAAGLGLCGVIGGRRRLGGRACLGGDVARTRARGFGVTETNAVVAWFETAWAALSAELRLSHHLALTLGVEGDVLFERPTFGIHGAPSTFTPSPVAGVVAAGLAVPF
ncbi:MAG TPA: hypothetical protein VGK52_15345 [Polyangia bacterium]